MGSQGRSRAINTLIGGGWFDPPAENVHHEPKNVADGWGLRSRSALRKCLFLPVPPHLQNLAVEAPVQRKMPPPPTKREVLDDLPRSSRHPVLMFPAVVPQRVDLQARKRELYAQEKAKLLAPPKSASWFEDPIALGTLLILVPPIGLAALWSSKRYSNDARWALTVMTALMMCVATAITVALIVRS